MDRIGGSVEGYRFVHECGGAADGSVGASIAALC